MCQKNKSDDLKKVNFDRYVAYLDSPIGLLEIQSEQEKIVELNFRKEKRYKEQLDSTLIEAQKQLNDYFNGERKEFDLALKITGTEFQKDVWRELMKIPYGDTVSYKDIAIAIGNNNACRAVGNANNKNQLPIIIPCHRVVGSNGLGGYGAGVSRKKWLLEHEKNNLKGDFHE